MDGAPDDTTREADKRNFILYIILILATLFLVSVKLGIYYRAAEASDLRQFIRESSKLSSNMWSTTIA